MKEIIKECKKRIKALHDCLHGRNLAIVYDWNMETLLIGPRARYSFRHSHLNAVHVCFR